jgi:hypothetical protein
MATFDTNSILPGDVLLHRGSGQISALIAWAGDSPFSHAAFVYDDAQISEAAAVGVRHMPLAGRLADTTDFLRIDVYRRTGGVAANELAGIRAIADGYLGTPYPINELSQLAVICALRDKIPVDNRLRLLLREVSDHLIDNDPHHLVCSEFVYRAFAEAKVTPSIAPRIAILDWVDTPFPHIDWIKLVVELEEDKKRAQNAQNNRGAPAPSPPSPSLRADVIVSADELREKHAELREALGVSAKATPATNSATIVNAMAGPLLFEPNPNPRAILPADLASSPDFTRLGSVFSAS